MGGWVLVRATAVGVLPTPTPYVLGTLGALLYWAGASLDILALGPTSDRSLELALGTIELVACLCAVLVASRLGGEDRSGHFAPIVGASSAGASVLWTCRVGG